MRKRVAWGVSGALAFLLVIGVFWFVRAENVPHPPVELAGHWASATSVQTRLESASTAVGNGHVTMALRAVLEPGWKTYWRVPGDSGIAPQLDWSGSLNVKSVEMLWPEPQAFDEFGERFYGYKGTVVWPLKVVVKDPEQPLKLSLEFNFGVCADVCIPTSTKNEVLLPVGDPRATVHAVPIEASLTQVPLRAGDEEFAAKVNLAEIRGYRAELEIAVAGSDQHPNLVVASGITGVYLGASQPYGEKGFRVPLEADAPETLRGKSVDLLFLFGDGARAVEGTFFIE